MTEAMTEALFELLILECRVDEYGTARYYNALGKLHRVYGPSVEWLDGYRAWYQDGQTHRLDGPAAEYPDGRRDWYQNGQRHRLDGPAIEYSDGTYAWWLNDKELTQAEWQQVVTSMESV